MCCLGLQAVKFAVLFVLRSGTVKIFVSLHPKVDGIVHGDHHHSGSPSVLMLFGRCIGEEKCFPFLRDVSGEEMVPSQLSLFQNSFVVCLGMLLDGDCVGVKPFCQTATDCVNQ